jgi:tetratricopeptide (TPR) repeat protein
MMRTILTFTLFVGTISLASAKEFVLPPDSTTSIVDKTTAAYMIDEGRTMYLEGKVKNALNKFREASVKDPNSWKANYWIGKCHYVLNNYGYSLKYASLSKELSAQDKVDEEVYLLMAESYHRIGKLDSAMINYTIALERIPSARAKTLRVEELVKSCQFAIANLDTTLSVRTSAGDKINSGYDEYNVVLGTDGKSMYFTSRRSNTTGGGLNPDDQLYFEDTYRIVWDEAAKSWGEASNELGKLNSDGFDALNFVSTDETWGIMTLNTTATEAKKTTKGSDIAELKKNTKDTWNTPKVIKNKSINTSFFEGSATLTADGNTMYFVSDRKGEKSSTDIYAVQKNGKSWGVAKPLPFNVNTAGRETTPYITPDGKYLFFSSDGHTGFGGLDVFVSENLGDSWSDPVNLGTTINTVNNDSHFVYSSDKKKGYISGIQIEGSKASLDIFELDLSNFTIPKK